MKKLLTILGGISLGILISANASALPLIENGDFKTGDFSDWEVKNVEVPDELKPFQGWQINNGTLNPPFGGDPWPPISGSFDAKTLQIAPGENILSQSFDVPVEFIASATLSWSDRIENYGLGGDFLDPGQEFRVAILSDTDIFEIFSTNPNDPPFQPDPNDPDYDLPNNRSFDVTSILRSYAGQLLTLSFSEADSIGPFNVTVDDISLEVQTTPVPEPATLLLLSTGLFGLAGYGLKRRQRK